MTIPGFGPGFLRFVGRFLKGVEGKPGFRVRFFAGGVWFLVGVNVVPRVVFLVDEKYARFFVFFL